MKRINVSISEELYKSLGTLVDGGVAASRGSILRKTIEEIEPTYTAMAKALRKLESQPAIARREAQIFLGESLKQGQIVLDEASDALGDLPDDD